MKIGTFNVRCSWEGDGINSFVHRSGMILQKIREEKPDVIAFQEVTDKICDFLQEYLPEYYLLGHGRMENYKGEGVFTAIRKDSIQLISVDTIWMTDTPYVYSALPNQICPRTCVISIVKEKNSGEMFLICNTHLDHQQGKEGEEVRINELKIIAERICEEQRKRDIPCIILGDFNTIPDSEVIEYCNHEFVPQISDVTRDILTSFHDFGRMKMVNYKIDYIYVEQRLVPKVKEVQLWDEEMDGIYLSDHYPIFIEIK